MDILRYLFQCLAAEVAGPDPRDVEIPAVLARAGFSGKDVNEAMGWLGQVVELCARSPRRGRRRVALRRLLPEETEGLTEEALGLLAFLIASKGVTVADAEVLIEAARQYPRRPVDAVQLKAIALMVFWCRRAPVSPLLIQELLQEESAGQAN